MVQIVYKGISALYVPGYKLTTGHNEIQDEDFYKLMKLKTFKFRVEDKKIEVPADFPLDKPSQLKKPEISKPSELKSDDLENSEEKTTKVKSSKEKAK